MFNDEYSLSVPGTCSGGNRTGMGAALGALGPMVRIPMPGLAVGPTAKPAVARFFFVRTMTTTTTPSRRISTDATTAPTIAPVDDEAGGSSTASPPSPAPGVSVLLPVGSVPFMPPRSSSSSSSPASDRQSVTTQWSYPPMQLSLGTPTVARSTGTMGPLLDGSQSAIGNTSRNSPWSSTTNTSATERPRSSPLSAVSWASDENDRWSASGGYDHVSLPRVTLSRKLWCILE
mmetsp:Transcript_16103/g.50351  ORF Transcript_16103/g.50351 Transcript_16103/m.50351 type:complete len:232 (+) Transcript_16103:785-1480(+)